MDNKMNVSTPEEAVAAGSELFDGSPMSESDREKQMETWRIELEQVESEISTLRAVLTTKMRRSAELKRQLGITAWKEISDDVNQGIKNVKDSNVLSSRRVEQVAKAVVDAPIYQKTSSLIGGITGGISTKLGQIRHSESFKSFEEKASTAIENVKTKVVSRSGSQQSLDGESAKSRSGSIVTSPTIPEDKPLA